MLEPGVPAMPLTPGNTPEVVLPLAPLPAVAALPIVLPPAVLPLLARKLMVRLRRSVRDTWTMITSSCTCCTPPTRMPSMYLKPSDSTRPRMTATSSARVTVPVSRTVLFEVGMIVTLAVGTARFICVRRYSMSAWTITS